MPVGELVKTVMESLARQAQDGGAKVRWTACFAIGAMLEAASAVPSGLPAPWLGSVLVALQQSVDTSANFKVRIAAAQALGVPSMRSSYGDGFAGVFKCLVNALSNLETISDFAEYKYKDDLKHQVSVSLLRLVRMTQRGDFVDLKDFLVTKADAIYNWLEELEASALMQARLDAAMAEDERARVAAGDDAAAAAVAAAAAPTDSDSDANVTIESVTAAFRAMTVLYESRMKTIPLALLKKYQSKAFG